jgi:tetratricopeptide (TPR) repeat protein/transcriptional regulator with XRE-family HTH domain
MAPPQSFALLLRRYRHGVGLTLEKLSETSGVSVRAISNMELGHSRGPQRRTLELIAKALDLADHDREALFSAAEVGRKRGFEQAPAVLAMPRGVTDFVGRAAEFAFLRGLVGSQAVGPAPVVVVSGAPGVGKSSFAVHAATALAGTFPDGLLFLDLRGLDERPLEPTVILGRLINAIAPDQRDLPHDEVERAGLYRTLLTRRRLVIVLDNAADEAQVRMLLPGAGASLLLVTSRRRLTGLDTAHRLPLAPLSRAHAVELLTRLMGHRADTEADAEAETGAVQRLAELGGNLPLALRLIGNWLASHGDTSAGRFVRRLSAEERRLEALTAGDTGISAVFTSSYVQLSDEAQQLFRRLALVPAGDTGPEMAAVLVGTPLEQAERALDELVEHGLLQSPFTDRYRLHDLLRLFARARLDEAESPADTAATRDRVESWLLSTATVAGRWFEPAFGSLPPDWDDQVPMQTVALAQRWIETEADNWLAALRTAAAGRRFAAVVAVAEAMHWFSDRWAHWGHWTEVFGLASAAAEELGDARATATQLNYLSWALSVCDGDSGAAVTTAQRAYAVAESAGDVGQQGWALCYQAWAYFAEGDAEAVFAAARRALPLLRRAGDSDGLSQALFWIARGHEELGRTDDALRVYRQRLALVADPVNGPSPSVADSTALSTRASIGRLYIGKGEWDAAVQVLLPVVALADTVAIPAMQALALAGLGTALCETGRCGEGLEHLRAAEALYRRLGNEPETARVRALLRTYVGEQFGE